MQFTVAARKSNLNNFFKRLEFPAKQTVYLLINYKLNICRCYNRPPVSGMLSRTRDIIFPGLLCTMRHATTMST